MFTDTTCSTLDPRDPLLETILANARRIFSSTAISLSGREIALASPFEDALPRARWYLVGAMHGVLDARQALHTPA